MRSGHISDSDDEEGPSDDSAMTKCVLLEGLAQAKHLLLTIRYSTMVHLNSHVISPNQLFTIIKVYMCVPVLTVPACSNYMSDHVVLTI